jgi:hypothetical protein
MNAAERDNAMRIASKVLLLIAVIILALAAFGVGGSWPVGLVPLGLAVGFASFLVP